MKRYLKTKEEVTQALREGKTVQTNEMEYGIINNLIVGFDKIVREISINPAIRLSENPYIDEPELLKLEVGKFYKTRDGRKAWVVSRQQGAYYAYNIAVLGNVCVYTVNENGTFCDNRPSPEDLVASWEE